MSKNRLQLDYVASSFLPSFRFGNGCKHFVREISKHLIHSNNFLKSELKEIQISGLVNAYSETHFISRITESGHNVRSLFPGGNVFADSGGLQQARMGEKFTEETKRAIYLQQSTSADLAFAFDELPHENVNGSMVYRPDRVGECGTQAGKNLKEQIEYFDEINAVTMPIGIVQGMGLDDGLGTYTRNMMGQLNQHQLSSLECWAIGGVIWMNPVDTLQKTVQTYQIDGIPDKMRKHFHILGITGREKLIPQLIAAKNGLFPGIERLSFDSTTMTQSWLFGNIHTSLSDLKSPNPKRNLGKIRDQFVEEFYEKLWLWWSTNPENVFDSSEDLLRHSVFNSAYPTAAKQYKHLGIEESVKTIVQKMAFVQFNTFNFFEIVQNYLNGSIQLEDFMGNYKQLPLLQTLEQIHTIEQFDEFIDYATLS
jgi:hypothetical protein